ncbi:MAG: 23S rRNA (guanosine(2251)-2'-O)-methyltransferase RlmB [Spirochaetales bacterium]|nr:23S rRNA (guanosine(2251)-2'-O)-methyltransferase RlmB [Spirochaetales bacterium]
MLHYIHGIHSIEEHLKKAKGTLLVSRKKDRKSPLIFLANERQIPVRFVDDSELDRCCRHKKHKGFVFVTDKVLDLYVRDIDSFLQDSIGPNALVLLLDEITDPHNYGAILRTANLLNTDLVITTARKTARNADIISVTSSGADAHVHQAVVSNLTHGIEKLKKAGFWIYGADMDGKKIFELDFKGRVGIVLGSEGKGLKRLLRENCDDIATIPQLGDIDSYNVSVAAGILMYEVRRQQGFSLMQE